MHRIKIIGLAVAAVLTIGATAAGANASAAATEQAIQQWGRGIRVLPLPSRGCYNASYPRVQWQKVACRVAPHHPFLPAHAQESFLQEVGDANDYSAEVAGLITSAIGSIPSVSAGASETGVDPNTRASDANTFSLQLNSEFFPATTTICKGHGLPSLCSGWQQFVYVDSPEENEVFMQYWIIKYNNPCPSGWWEYSFPMSTEIYCYKNSSASTLSGDRLTVSGLAGTTFEGSANASGNDAVVMTTASGNATATGAGSVLGLGNEWKAAEFGVFGDADGSQATFSARTTITVHTVVKSNSDEPPACVPEGFTGETNNLNLEGTPALSTQPFPTIASRQTNASGATPASCATFGVISPPSVTTTTAPNVTQTSATLEGTVNPNGANVTACKFEYGTTTSYGKTANCAKLPGAQTAAVAVSAAIKSLIANTTYDYRISATNAAGTTKGANGSFET
jgi:hypothetical protein